MDWTAAIQQRHSVRRYQRQPVPKELVTQVVNAGKNAAALYPDIYVRWYTVWDGSSLARHLEGLASIYGLFDTAPHYLIAVSQERPGYMENLGFRMEQLILTATDLGLGTCWIGGMFEEEKLQQTFAPDLGPDERIVALTPLGYKDPSTAAQMAQRLFRWGSDQRGRRRPLTDTVSQDVWIVPWEKTDPTLDHILELTRQAPSWTNTQPWHFVIGDGVIVATVHNKPQKGNIREGKPYYRLDGGIAMCHLYLAAQGTAWQGTWNAPVKDEEQIRTRYAIPDQYDILGIFETADMPTG